MSPTDFSRHLKFVEIPKSYRTQQKEDDDDNDDGDDEECMLWPCLHFKNSVEFNSVVAEFQNIIGHGPNEKMEYRLCQTEFRTKAVRLLNDRVDHLQSQANSRLDRTELVYLLGKECNLPEGPDGRKRRLVFAPFNCHSFAQGNKLSEFMKRRQEIDGFVDTMEEAFMLTGQEQKQESVWTLPAPAEAPTATLQWQASDVPNEPPSSWPSARTGSSEEFTEKQAVFVPRSLPNGDRVYWPAMEFSNSTLFLGELESRGLVANQDQVVEFLRSVMNISQEHKPPFAYFMGDIRCSPRVIPTSSRRDLIHYIRGFPLVHQYINVPGFEKAFMQLMRAIGQTNGMQPTKRPSSKGVPDKAIKPTKTQKRQVSKQLADSTNKKPIKKLKKLERVKVKNESEVIHMTALETPRCSYSAQDLEAIPSFSDVKPLLEEAGYTFSKGCYGLPGKVSEGGPIEGIDYFENEREFREYLCVNGIPLGNGIRARDHKFDPLKAWVSYHRLAKLLLEEDRLLSSVKRISNKEERDLLVKIGIAWQAGSGWIIEGRKGRVEDSNLKNELASLGIPPTCDLSKLDVDERLSLELYVGDPSNRFGFF